MSVKITGYQINRGSATLLRNVKTMLFLYNLGIYFYFLLLKIASFFHPKARLWIDGRHDFFSKLKTQLTDNQNIIWFHCASLGEFEQGRPLIEAIKKEQPQYKILLTFFSPSGYEIRKNYAFADYVCYLPLDTAHNARQFLDLVQPKMAFFIKYEFWYHFLKNLHTRQIPTYLVAAIFRPNQIFFKWYGGFFRQLLDFFTIIFLQENFPVGGMKVGSWQVGGWLHYFKVGSWQVSGWLRSLPTSQPTANLNTKQPTANLPTTNYLVTGDTRIDRVAQLAANAPTLPLIEAFCKNKKTLICGSTWAKDEALLKELMLLSKQKEEKKRNYIIAPHQIPSELPAKEAFPIEFITYSKTSPQPPPKEGGTSISEVVGTSRDFTSPPPLEGEGGRLESRQVLYLDNIGMLSSIYQYGYIAYIGGGFGAGIHNTLEPIAFGLPVIFGPKYKKFAEANYLVESKGGFCVHNIAELEASISYIENNYAQCSLAAKAYIEQHQGATKKIMKIVFFAK